MSDFQVADGSLGGQPIDETSTTLQNNLGRRVVARDMATTDYGFGEFVYLKGLDATIVGTVVTFNYGDHQTALATANAVGLIGVAMSACVTSSYGWYQIQGASVMEVLTSFAADLVPYLTSTAGEVDDAVVVGDLISGAISQTAIATPAAGQAVVSIQYPYVTNASN